MTKEHVDRIIAVMESMLRHIPSLCLEPGCSVVTSGYCVAHAPKCERF